MKSSLY